MNLTSVSPISSKRNYTLVSLMIDIHIYLCPFAFFTFRDIEMPIDSTIFNYIVIIKSKFTFIFHEINGVARLNENSPP